MKIEVCERILDRTWDDKPKYHAQIENEPGYWGCGKSVDEAIGNLINSHPKTFGIKIDYIGREAR